MTASRKARDEPKRPRAAGPEPKKSANGTWGWVFDSAHPNPDGSRRQIRRRGFPTRTEARKALDEELRNDQKLLPSFNGPVTVNRVFAELIRAKELAGRAPNTVAQYRWARDRAAELWGEWEASKLTQAHLENAYLDMLGGPSRKQWRRGVGTTRTDRPLSRRSVEVFHKSVKAAFQHAVDKGLLHRNPAALIELASGERKARPYWTPAQVGEFIAFADSQTDLPIGLVDVVADTGARAGEVMGIRWSDVDLVGATVSIVRQLVADPVTGRLTLRPTKRPRAKSTIGVYSGTVGALLRRREQQDADREAIGRGWSTDPVASDLVFTWPDGSPINPKTMSRILARLTVQSGLPRLTAHGLRHSFATAALSARVPVEVVAARLGNTARVVQEVYQHVLAADDAATAKLVGDLYRKAAE